MGAFILSLWADHHSQAASTSIDILYTCTVVWNYFLEKDFVFKKGRVKNISRLMFTHENI